MIKPATHDEVRAFVVEMLRIRNPTLDPTKPGFFETDYFAAGYLDSFGAIEAIGAIEEKFNIRLDADDLENPDFKIVSGLIRIIEEKLAK